MDQLGPAIELAAWNLTESLGAFIKEPFQANEFFDITERPDLLYETPILFSFPFFLTDSRRNFFGVIPYGDHESIGFLLSKKLLLEVLPAGIGEIKDEGKLKKFFNDLINTVATKQGTIYNFRGFIYKEILPQMVADLGSPDTMSRFTKIAKEEIPVTDADDLEYSALETIKKAGDHSVVVIDLVIKKALEQSLSEQSGREFIVVQIEHKQPIPVGIGFTLPLLPKLLQDNNWDGLLNAAARIIQEEAMQDRFKAIGIRLREDFLQRYNMKNNIQI